MTSDEKRLCVFPEQMSFATAQTAPSAHCSVVHDKKRAVSARQMFILPVWCKIIAELRTETVDQVIDMVRTALPMRSTIAFGALRAHIALECAPFNSEGRRDLHVCGICFKKTAINKAPLPTSVGISVVRLRKQFCVAVLHCRSDKCREAAQAITRAAFDRLK